MSKRKLPPSCLLLPNLPVRGSKNSSSQAQKKRVWKFGWNEGGVDDFNELLMICSFFLLYLVPGSTVEQARGIRKIFRSGLWRPWSGKKKLIAIETRISIADCNICPSVTFTRQVINVFCFGQPSFHFLIFISFPSFKLTCSILLVKWKSDDLCETFLEWSRWKLTLLLMPGM